MRLKVPFFGFVLAGIAFLLPLVVLFALLPSLINAEPVKKRFIEELQSWTGSEVELAGPVAIESFGSLSFNAENVAFKGFKGLPSLKSLRAGRVVARIAWLDLLAGNLDFDKIKIYDAVMRLGPTNRAEARQALLAAWTTPHETPFAAFVLVDSTIELEGADLPSNRVGIANIVVSLDGASRQIDLSGRFDWRGERVSFELETGTLPAEPNGSNIPINATISSQLFQGNFDGTAEPAQAWNANGQLSVSTPDLIALSKWLDAALGIPTQGAISLAGTLDLSDERVHLRSANLSVGASEAFGDLSVVRNRDNSKVEGSLAFNQLDVGALWALNGAKTPKPTFRNTALGQSLRNARLDLRVSASRVHWNELAMGAAAFTLTGGAGVISAEIAHLDLFGGSLLGHIEADLRKDRPIARARVTAENIDVAAPMSAASQTNWLSGRVDANIDAETQGLTLAQLMKGLTVRARVAFPEGGQMRLDLAQLAQSASGKSLDGWSQADLSWQSFNELRFRLSLKDNQLHCSNLTLLAPNQVVKGNGSVDLDARDLDWQLAVQPSSAPSGWSGDQQSEAGSAAKSRLSIQGPWARPVISSRNISSRAAGDADPAASIIESRL